MARNSIEGSLQQFSGVKQTYGSLTADHIHRIAGTHDQRCGDVQVTDGINENERRIQAFEAPATTFSLAGLR